MKQDGTPGAVVLVRSKKGNWTSAFGVRVLGDPIPVQVGDVFRLADITATMTVTVLLQLQEQHKLSLDDPISKYVAGVPNGSAITLRGLASYQSGLFDFEQDRTFHLEYAKNTARGWTPQELLKLAFAHPAEAPGTESVTSTDFVLLGLVIEKVTGQPAAKVFESNLFQPLGLTRIGLAGDATLPGPHANGYTYAADPFGDPLLTADQRRAAADGALQPRDRTTDNPSWAFTAGAAFGDAESTADLLTGMVSGPLLDASSRAERIAGMSQLGPIEDADAVQYGIGLARYGQYLFYSGNMPGYSSFAAIDPTSSTTIVVLTNLAWTPEGGSPVSKIFTAVATAVEPVVLPGN